MSERHPKSQFTLMMMATVLLVLLSGYFLCYFAIVEAEEDHFHAGNAILIVKSPKYRFGGEWAAAIFRPAHAIDCRVRPAYWE